LRSEALEATVLRADGLKDYAARIVLYDEYSESDSHANVATQCEDMYSSDTAASRPGAMRSSTRVSIPLACSMSESSSVCSAIDSSCGAKRITEAATDRPSP